MQAQGSLWADSPTGQYAHRLRAAGPSAQTSCMQLSRHALQPACICTRQITCHPAEHACRGALTSCSLVAITSADTNRQGCSVEVDHQVGLGTLIEMMWLGPEPLAWYSKSSKHVRSGPNIRPSRVVVSLSSPTPVQPLNHA